MSAVAEPERIALRRGDRQHTVAGEAVVRGRGLLGGHEAELVICPAPPGTGIVFERIDLSPPVTVAADATQVIPRSRRTTLRAGRDSIETVEHCLSALSGLRVDNAVLRLSGPELPCGDGSALPFTEALDAAGLVEQDAPRRVFRLREPIMLEEGDAMIAAMPDDGDGMKVLYDLDHGADDDRIPHQCFAFDPARQDYRREIAPARTFSLREEAEALVRQQLCRHLTPRDVLVIGDDGPIDNAYRFPDEPVRHKILDVIGDLSLAGRPIAAQIVARRSGHGLNRRLALKLRERLRADDLSASLASDRALDTRAIQRIMPHRYPMLLVDRVLELDGNRRAVGVKNVTVNEPFFQGHYPGTPIMPGVLIVEAMAQLGGLLLSQTLEHAGRIAMLLSLDKVKLRKPIVPGDQVILEAQTQRANARSATVHCRATVDGKLAAEAQIRFMMVDSEQA